MFSKSILIYLTFLFFPLFFSYSQWSTSAKAESALYVCPGFSQHLITQDDGSSIICGVLTDSRYVQKLDAYGYKKWLQPVTVFNTPGTNNTNTSIIGDDDGGVIVLWADNRGAETGGQGGTLNNAVYMQRIDKHGAILWTNGGIQIASAAGGIKWGYGISDGSNGIILYMIEIDSYRQNATKKKWSWIVRYNGDGQKIWSIPLDTNGADPNQPQIPLPVGKPVKIGERVMFNTISGLKFIHPISGNYESAPKFVPRSGLILDGDSAAFHVEQLSDQTDSSATQIIKRFVISRINSQWDSTWSQEVEYRLKMSSDTENLDRTQAQNIDVVQPDKNGGLFHSYGYSDTSGFIGRTVRWVTQSKVHFTNNEVKLKSNFVSAYGFNGNGQFGIVDVDKGIGQKIDTSGQKLWPEDDTLMFDPSNAYSKVFGNDNNGGGIIAYWTTLGGIYAFHTGRNGKTGVITKILSNEKAPSGIHLSQNFPNPFNSSTSISFRLDSKSKTRLEIYDVLGRKIQLIVDDNLQSGHYKFDWSAGSNATGVYFYVLTTEIKRFTKKMLLVK